MEIVAWTLCIVCGIVAVIGLAVIIDIICNNGDIPVASIFWELVIIFWCVFWGLGIRNGEFKKDISDTKTIVVEDVLEYKVDTTVYIHPGVDTTTTYKITCIGKKK